MDARDILKKAIDEALRTMRPVEIPIAEAHAIYHELAELARRREAAKNREPFRYAD